MKKKIKGYNFPRQGFKVVRFAEENIAVGCRNCFSHWHEMTWIAQGTQIIVGTWWKYDMCSLCATPKQKKQLETK